MDPKLDHWAAHGRFFDQIAGPYCLSHPVWARVQSMGRRCADAEIAFVEHRSPWGGLAGTDHDPGRPGAAARGWV